MTMAPDAIATILAQHANWLRGEAGGQRAYLGGANLRGANLRGAYLRGADLTGANLRGAYLGGADLTGANLTGAYLGGADLTGADLTGAYLTGANLTGAYLRGATLPEGYTFDEYLDAVVPALCAAGGVPLEQVVTPGHWGCNDWDNCPMAAAFQVTALEQVPPLYRGAARLFVTLFDAGQIPLDRVRAACKLPPVPAVPA